MAQRHLSRSKKPIRRLRRVDPKRVLQDAEFIKMQTWAMAVLQNAVDTDTGLTTLELRNAVIVLVLLGTAARRFELCAFRCGNFYLINAEPYAHFDQGKGNIEAAIPLSDQTWQHVQQWLAIKQKIGEKTGTNDPLFCGRDGGYLSRAQLNNIWNTLLATTGVAKKHRIGPHSARHTAGMLYLRATGSLPKTREFMRHSDVSVTERFYAHVLPSDVRAGMNKAGL